MKEGTKICIPKTRVSIAIDDVMVAEEEVVRVSYMHSHFFL